ncbi:ribonuclease H-like protein [Pleurotus eryngii]|uniref:Ribonuclease H-like protein n=1 Tax=Pleurotus eryngii TaxID=5323 RepID=A0A9P5ZI56_PLEER|nr:ribonuclease H-like protein [Pleurotus eryngii]
MNPPQQLPSFTPLPLLLASGVKNADEIVDKLGDEAVSNNFFGFDLEITTCKRVRLVQIATRQQAYIFDIDLLGGFPKSLEIFLGNPAYIKLGVGVAGDAKVLKKVHKVELRGGGELSRLHRMFDMSGAKLDIAFSLCVALQTLTEKWLGMRLDKSLQTGKEWDGTLGDHHYNYAAADACVAVAIYDKMMANHLLANARTSLWIFTDIDPSTAKCIGLSDDYAPHMATNPKYIKAIEGALRKAMEIFEQANDERPGDGNRTWTEQAMPNAVALCDALTTAFSAYHLNEAGLDIN